VPPLAITGNSIVFLPGLDESGDNYVVVTYQANDGQQSCTGVVTVNVAPVNDPPDNRSFGPIVIPEDTLATITLEATDVDGPLPTPAVVLTRFLPANGKSYAYDSSKPDGIGAELTMNQMLPDQGGQVMVATAKLPVSNKFVFKPNLNWNGRTSTYTRAWDSIEFSAPSSERVYQIVVTPVNDAPTVTYISPENGKVLDPAKLAVEPQNTLLIKAVIADPDVGTSPMVMTITFDSKATLTLNGYSDGVTAAGSYSITAPIDTLNGYVGAMNYKSAYTESKPKDETLTITVNDQGASGAGGPLSGSTTLTITVGATQLPPPVAAQNNAPIIAGAAFAGVFGAVAAYAVWQKMHPKLYQEGVDPFASQNAGGENPLFEGGGFQTNPLFEKSGV